MQTAYNIYARGVLFLYHFIRETGPLVSKIEADLENVRALLSARAPQRVRVPGAIEAAVAIILSPVSMGWEVLLIKRAEREGDPWSGQMAFPGGRRDADDADLLATAMRETREETGIRLEQHDVLGDWDDLFRDIPELPRVVVRPFVFGVPARPVIRPNHEVATHVWASFDELQDARAVTEVPIRGETLSVESFELGEHVVWGMTHRMLGPLVDLLL